MKKVLFINSPVQNCGIHQFGKRLYEIIRYSSNINYIYRIVSSFDEYIALRNELDPEFTLLNWYHTTMNWLPPDMDIVSRTKHYFIFHERPVRKYYDKYLFFGEHNIINGVIDSTNRVIPDKCITLPRPLFEYENKYSKNEIPLIGSFGFMSSWNKGFDIITTIVNNEFDVAELNLHITWSPFCDPDKIMMYQMADRCRKLNIKPDIKLNITHELIDNKSILDFLAKNDLNVFLYKSSPQYGLSSATDYALSVRRPIATDGSIPFRHMIKDEINVNKHSLKEIINSGIIPLEEFYEKWSPNKLRAEMERVFLDVK